MLVEPAGGRAGGGHSPGHLMSRIGLAALNRRHETIAMPKRGRGLVIAWLIGLACLLPSGALYAAGMYGQYDGDRVIEFNAAVLGDTRALTMRELMPALLEALDRLSKYPKPAKPPMVLRVSRAQLNAIACGGVPCGVMAIYRPEAGIYLDDHLHPETDLFARSVLLHEMVHYVQDLRDERGDMRPCERWYYRELEAYAVQKQFLMAIGSPVRVGYSAAQPTCDDDAAAPAAATRRDSIR